MYNFFDMVTKCMSTITPSMLFEFQIVFQGEEDSICGNIVNMVYRKSKIKFIKKSSFTVK